MSTSLPETAISASCLSVLLTVCTKNTSVNVPIKQTATVQERNTAKGGSSCLPSSSSAFFFISFVYSFPFFSVSHPTLPPTHAAQSANISHTNGKRLFVEELHITPPPPPPSHWIPISLLFCQLFLRRSLPASSPV